MMRRFSLSLRGLASGPVCCSLHGEGIELILSLSDVAIMRRYCWAGVRLHTPSGLPLSSLAAVLLR
jgi:hypothetical protein